VIGTSATNAVVWLIIFVVVDSRTIFGPVVLYLFGGERATTQLDWAKGWLGAHNDAVMAALFQVLGVDFIAEGVCC